MEEEEEEEEEEETTTRKVLLLLPFLLLLRRHCFLFWSSRRHEDEIAHYKRQCTAQSQRWVGGDYERGGRGTSPNTRDAGGGLGASTGIDAELRNEAPSLPLLCASVAHTNRGCNDSCS